MEENVRKNSSFLFVGIVIILGIFLRLGMLVKNASFSFDESALAYNILSLKYANLFDSLHLQQVSPPLFLVGTKWIVSLFSTSEIFFRIIPFVFSCGSLVVFYYLLKEIFGDNSSPINFSMLLFAINPKMIYFGAEFKPYTLDVFFAILIFYLFLKLDLKSYDWKKLLIFGAGLALTLWFSFPSAILVFVGMLTLLISQKEYKKWLILFVPILVSFGLFGLYFANIYGFYNNFMTSLFAGDFNHFTLPVAYFFNNEIPFAILIISIILPVGIIYFMAEKKQFEISFIMWAFICTIALSQVHLYPAYQRFMLFLLPYTIIILAMVFASLIRKKNFQSRLVLIFVLLSLIPISVNYKNSESRELTEYFLENVNANDLVIVDNIALPDFLYYTRDTEMKNKIIVPFERKHGKILYKLKSENNFPTEYKSFWYYATRTKDFDKVIEKDENLELINDYNIENKMITKNGGVFKVSKIEH